MGLQSFASQGSKESVVVALIEHLDRDVLRVRAPRFQTESISGLRSLLSDYAEQNDTERGNDNAFNAHSA